MEYWRRKWATEEPPIPLPMMHTVASSPPADVVAEEEVCGNVRPPKIASKKIIFSGNITISSFLIFLTTSFAQDNLRGRSEGIKVSS